MILLRNEIFYAKPFRMLPSSSKKAEDGLNTNSVPDDHQRSLSMKAMSNKSQIRCWNFKKYFEPKMRQFSSLVSETLSSSISSSGTFAESSEGRRQFRKSTIATLSRKMLTQVHGISGGSLCRWSQTCGIINGFRKDIIKLVLFFDHSSIYSLDDDKVFKWG